MADEKKSIFELIDKFGGYDGPFKEDWEKDDFKLKQNNGAKIVDMNISTNHPLILSGGLMPPQPNNSRYVNIMVVVNVFLEGIADMVEITCSNGQKATARPKFGTGQFEAFFNLSVAKSFARINEYNEQEFTFTARVTDVFLKKTTDTRSIKITANTEGGIGDTRTQLTEFHIYSDGKIEEIAPKLNNPNSEKKANYIYHDENNKEHQIGVFKINTIENIYGKSYGGTTVDLVDIRELKNYLSDSVYFRLSINTSRYFMNTQTLGSLIGAMLECSFNDFVFNGFSNEKGESVGGSSSHKNGYNGDLRYLRKDLSGRRMDLRKSDETGDPCGWEGLDEERQNEFNDALFKFGWKSMLSWKYDGDKLLNHCKHFDKHWDHLHIQGYKPNYKKIIR